MTNKEIVTEFIDRVFNAWDLTDLNKYMRADYRQHSHGVKDGRDGFCEFAEEFFNSRPHMHIFRMAEDGDLVFVFFKCTFGDNEETAAKVCDIYRLEDGLLAEHWDVVQSIDPDDPCAGGRGHF